MARTLFQEENSSSQQGKLKRFSAAVAGGDDAGSGSGPGNFQIVMDEVEGNEVYPASVGSVDLWSRLGS